MQFLFNLFNHNATGQRSLEDVVGIFGHQLRALGHAAVWDPKNDRFLAGGAGVNIVVEGFTEATVRVLADARAQGARIVILATEEPGPRGFNQGTQAEMVRRQEVFPHAARHCEGILHLVPGEHVTRWYGQFAPAAQAELGYAPTLMRDRWHAAPDYDFGFYGSVSPRRLSILKRLARRMGTEKAVRVVSDFKTQAERDAEMRRARVVLQIRKFEAMGLVSSSRCNTALCLGRPVVAEPHLLPGPWAEVIHFSATPDRFYQDAITARAAWQAFHAGQVARFIEKLSPEACAGRSLREIGIGAEPRRMAS